MKFKLRSKYFAIVFLKVTRSKFFRIISPGIDLNGRHELGFHVTNGLMSFQDLILLSNHFKLKKWIKMKLTVSVEMGVSQQNYI